MKQSAGLLVYRKNGANLEVLLVHPGGPFFARKDVWGIPKGDFEENEDPASAAKREFREELGCPPPGGDYLELGEVKTSSKKILAWAVEGNINAGDITSNTFEMEWPPGSGRRQNFPEVDKAAWMPLAIARSKMHQGQDVFLERLAEKLDLNLQPPLTQGSLF